jgi:hypothetical protein
MKQIRTAGSILVAMLAISAIASASASAALPELVNSKGEELVKKKYTATSGKGKFQTEKNGIIECEKDTATGEVTGPKTGTTTVKFTKCAFSGLSCKTAGASSGEIRVEAVSKLVYINKSTKEVGLDLEAKESTVECPLEKLKVRGSVIGVIAAKDVNTPVTEVELVFKQTGGKQEPSQYENEKGEKVTDITETEGSGLKTFKFEPSGLSSTDVLKFEETIEIKA